MQYTVALYLLTLASVALGLLLASLPYLGNRVEGRPHPLWALSLTLFVISLGSFAWITSQAVILGTAQFGITTFANTLLFAAAALQAAFFRHLNAPDQTLPFVSITLAILSFAGLFEWVRQASSFDARVLLLTGMTGAMLVWQIMEILRLRTRESTPQINFLLWTTVGELICMTLRFMLALWNEANVAYFTQIPAVLIAATMLNGLFNLLSYVGINKYWAEKTSLDRASALFESTQIKALAAEKDRLILRLMAANKTAASGALSASVTHELAQPLTALGLNLSSLKHSLAQSPPDAEQQRLLERCVDNTQRLHAVLRTVRSMFLTNEIAEENFAIGSVLESVASLAEMEAQRHGITLSIDGDGERIIRGRPSELQHALLNLTLNAMEALSPLRTPEKKVNIRAVEDNEALRIIVSDNGPGVSADMLERIFDMLDSDKPGGMGLGLWLCRHIAERHGGSIMHRPNLPSGAIFEFVLPNRPPVAMMEND